MDCWLLKRFGQNDSPERPCMVMQKTTRVNADGLLSNEMKSTVTFLLSAVVLTGCAGDLQTVSDQELRTWQAPVLPDARQELILNRAVELMKESGKWQGYPFRSIGFDEDRKQWKLEFSGGKPDEGYDVFIANEQADRIDIRLLPPMWTEYERKKSSNP
jgi:hypothetical protein